MKPLLAVTMVIAMTFMGLLSGNLSVFAAGRGSISSEPRQTLLQNRIERSYVVRIPRELAQDNSLVPLVLMLHGGGGNAEHAEKMTGFTEKAAKEGFIVVYPEGSSRYKGKLLTWNAGHCCGYAMENRVNDVEFISMLLDKLIKDYPVDTKRIYVTGMSNGGMMTHRLGIELSNRFAAIAPVVATVFGDEKRPDNVVSAIIFNGMLDEAVPFQGGKPGGRFANAWDKIPAKPAVEQAEFWGSANGCTAYPDKREQGASVLWQYHCPSGTSVVIYLLNDSGHAWPGGQRGSRRGDEPSSSINATDLIWEFFKAHTK